MKSHIKIENPCSEKWNLMQDSTRGKFCEKCSKYLIDFTDKTDGEVLEVFKNAEGNEICGKISIRSLSMALTGAILITNLSFVKVQVMNNVGVKTEQKVINSTKVSGKVIFKETKKEIANCEVYFIHKSKYIKTTTDERGNFALEIPNDLIEKKNVLYFDFEKLNQETHKSLDTKPTDSIYENTSVIFNRNEPMKEREFEIDTRQSYIGSVIIMEEQPPDYYYLNGKTISKRKFEKLKLENPNYQYFYFTSKEAEVVAKKSYLETVQLLYSR